jgi:streptogramin lyase
MACGRAAYSQGVGPARRGRIRGSLAALALLGSIAGAAADQQHPAADYIEGTVRSGDGNAEAGVWVIAETDELKTPYRKIVVTDDEGRFVVPDLPDASYRLWVRGYGLEDSARVVAEPGVPMALQATVAESAQRAAAIYPASYWLSLMEVPGHDPGWANYFKLGCQLCHQVGSVMTRARTRELYDLGLKKSTYMHVTAEGLGRERLLDALSEWSGRIMAGETPPAPPRPQGIERNLVITQWAWGDEYTYAHDEIATDKRRPTLYGNGPVYGVDLANDRLLMVDPQTHAANSVAVPTLSGFDTPWCQQTYRPNAGSVASDAVIPMGFGSLGCPVEPGITGFEGKYRNPANPHNPMFDDQGRVWITTQVRREWAQDLPAFCQGAPEIVDNYHHRQLGWFDTKTGQFQLIDTCYGTHHLQFDAKGVLWLSGDSHVIGWFDPARYDPARPETLAQAQGWSAIVIDADGDGKAETPVTGFNYGIIPNPVDGSVWSAQPGGDPGGDLAYRGRLVRFDPATGNHETFAPPAPGAGPRGVDVDTRGVIWASLGGSGHLARFDRSKCRQTWGAGQQCPEGWTLYRSPGPVMRTGDDPENEVGADFHYYLFVDQFDTLGLGNDVVVMNGTGSDSLLAFDPRTEQFTVIRVPYPLNTYTRGLDGRIDDPAAGWKGRGLWFTNGGDPIHHSEVPRSFVGKIQLRPDPLAR